MLLSIRTAEESDKGKYASLEEREKALKKKEEELKMREDEETRRQITFGRLLDERHAKETEAIEAERQKLEEERRR